MEGVVDLRSDTVTKPTSEMLEAIQKVAKEDRIGDDVFEEDETVQELENEAAAMLGKEAGIFLPTGTMGNLISIMGHCNDNFSEMIVGNLQHTYLYEVGSVSRIAGVHSWVLENQPDGTLKLQDIENAIRCKDVHHPTTKLISLENTHNSCGGIPLSGEYIDSVANLAKKHDIKVHIDGARIFNAATALNQSASRVAKSADSVTFCLSKGLGSPAGSVLVGNKSFIEKAKFTRKALGGGMRQSGILAACGLISLRAMTQRLSEDHETCRSIAEGLASMPELSIDLDSVQTNILFFDVKDQKSEQLVNMLETDYGVRVGAYSTTKVRAVTHHQVPGSRVSYILDAFHKSLRQIF